MNLDALGRKVAEFLCSLDDVKSVSTYGVCADVIHFELNGERYTIDISCETDINKEWS